MHRLKKVSPPQGYPENNDQVEISDTGTYRVKKQPVWPEQAGERKGKEPNIYLNKFKNLSRIDFEDAGDCESAKQLLSGYYIYFSSEPQAILLDPKLEGPVRALLKMHGIL